MISLEQLKLEL